MPVPVEITFLGTGSAVPTLRRAHPAILFQRSGDHWMYDCGENAQIGLLKNKVSPVKIDRIFISHWHADHFSGLLPLLETMHMSGKKDALEIYGPDAGRFVDDIMDLSSWAVGFKLRPIEAGNGGLLLDAGEYQISSVKVDHGMPAVGYVYQEKEHWNIDVKLARKFGIQPGPMLSKLRKANKIIASGKTIHLEDIAKMTPGRKIVYSGDTRVCKRLFEAARRADLLIHDGTFVEPVPTKFHSSVREVAKMAKKYEVKRLILTHFSRRYQDAKEILETAKPHFKNVATAYDGMKTKV